MRNPGCAQRLDALVMKPGEISGLALRIRVKHELRHTGPKSGVTRITMPVPKRDQDGSAVNPR